MNPHRPPLSGPLAICFLLVAAPSTLHAASAPSPSAASDQPITLDTIKAKARKAPMQGSAADGYRVDKAEVPGALGNRDLLDTPYAITVVPQEMLQNQQAGSLEEVLKYLPSAQIEARGGADVGRPQTRGFEGSVVQNSRMDGLNFVATTAYPMEQFEQVEILNGLAGAMYGPCNPAGLFSMTLKRPTDQPLRQATLGYQTQSIFTGHVDLGDRLGRNGWFGYRVNLLSAGGTGYVDPSSLSRKLGSFAVDLRPSERTVVELNYSYYRYRKMGFPGSFAYGATVPLPDAPDPTRVGYGQSFAGSLLTTKTASFRVRHELGQDWKLVLGMLDQDVTRDMSVPANTLSANGNYRTTISSSAASRFGLVSNMAYLSGHFRTGDIRHDLSVGTTGLQWTTFASNRTTTVVLGSASIDAPVAYPVPAWPVTQADYKSGVTRQQGLNLNDTLTFNDHWAFSLSASEDWIQNYSYTAAQVKSTAYKGSGFSGAGSLLFKPAASVTTYFTYANSLQQPDAAPTTAANAGSFLTPYRSNQYELGVKSRLAAINLGAALFRMERPFAYADPADNVFKVMGNQVNYGAELTAQGDLAERIFANAGLTLLDPRLRRTSLTATSGKQVVGVPRAQSNLLVEYRWPGTDEWATNLDWHYTAKRPANDTNSYWAQAYSTVDWGLRYAARSWAVPTTFRLNVNNLFSEKYWYSIFPGSINGTNSSASAFLGEPREIKLSAQMKF